MKTNHRTFCSARITAPALRLAALLALGSSAHSAVFTWDGTANLWNTVHWDAGAGLVAFPAGNSNANSAIISAGTVTFAGNDTFGNAATASSPIITLNSGGTLASGGKFNTMWNLALNGGTLLANGGVNSPFGAFGLKGTVTVGGSVASNISVGGGSNNTVSIGHGTNGTTTFAVADVTASTAADLNISTVLNNNSNVISGLIKAGVGTLFLSGANTYTGGTTISAGTILLGNAAGLGATTGTLAVNGGTLDLNNFSPTTGTLSGSGGTITNSNTGAVTFTTSSAANSSFAGAFTNGAGTLSVTKSGAGTLTLSGASTYTGATTVSAGRLDMAGTFTSSVTVANNANLGGEGTTTGSLTFSGTSALFFDPSSAAFLGANTINATGATVTLTPTTTTGGTGIVVLNAPGGITGTAGGAGSNFVTTGHSAAYFGAGNTQLLLDVTPGAWRGNDGTNPTFWDTNITTNWNFGSSPDKFLAGDVAIFDDTAASYSVVVQGASVSPASVTFNNTTAYNISGGAIAGTGTLVKNGAGALALNAANTYTGTTSLNGGITTVVSGALGTGTINFGGGTLQYAAGNTQDVSARIAGSTSAIALDTNGTSVAFATAIGATNSGGLTKTGAGTLTLNAANAYTGGTAVNGGVLAFASTGTLPAGAAITVGSGATLRFSRNDTFGNHATAVSQTIAVNGGSIDNGGNFFTTLGAVTLNGGTINSIGGANANFPSFSLRGPITVGGSAASTISASGVNSQMIVGSNTAGSQTTFDVADATGDSVADLVISAPLQNNQTAAFAAIATGILKTGNGTLTLSGTNTYTGPTTVSAGTLVVSGSISGSAVSVVGGTLGGTGGTVGATTVGAGGNFAPGASIGTLNFAGSLALGGSAAFELNKTGLALAADLASATGIITLGGTLNVTASGDTLFPGDLFNLFDAPSFAGSFDTLNLPGLSDISYSWDTSQIGVDGTIAVVPEPGAAASLLGGIGVLLGLRRRRA